LFIEQDFVDLIDWQDGLHDFPESYKSLKSPQIMVQTKMIFCHAWGTLTAESIENEGSVFIIHLPSRIGWI